MMDRSSDSNGQDDVPQSLGSRAQSEARGERPSAPIEHVLSGGRSSVPLPVPARLYNRFVEQSGGKIVSPAAVPPRPLPSWAYAVSRALQPKSSDDDANVLGSKIAASEAKKIEHSPPTVAAVLPASLKSALEMASIAPQLRRSPIVIVPIAPITQMASASLAPPGDPVLSAVQQPIFDVSRMASPIPSAVQQLGDVRPGTSNAVADVPSKHPANATENSKDKIRGTLFRALRIAGLVVVGWLALVVALICLFRFVNPPMSALMVQQRLSGDELTQEWVPIEAISPNLIRAVLLSEDGRFCQHWGVDFQEMQNAIERANEGDGVVRGASTISMQVAKNMFLWPSKSYVRKVLEIPLTYLIEAIWNKHRIMEIYLNVAEWGPGIFGVEAASQFHFGKSARRLSEREASRLAVALPNPYSRDAGDPGPGTRRLAADVQLRVQASSNYQTACVIRGD